MTIENWIALMGLFSSAIIGYLVKYLLDKKSRFSSENATIKREMYERYVKFIMAFITSYAKDGNQRTKAELEKEAFEKMREFHRMAILYSSPRVINAFADFLQYGYKHSDGDGNVEYITVLATNVFKEMRRDIGLSNRGLRSGAIRLIRPMINDYDNKVAPLEYGLLANARQSMNLKARKDKND